MKCWLTRLRARCACGCSFEAFALPPEEAGERCIARTRSGFAALVPQDPELLALVRRHMAEAGLAEPTPVQLTRLAALLGDPAPDGQPYDTALGAVCPRCGQDPADLRVDKQVPEVVLSLPLVGHSRWLGLGWEEQRAAVLAMAERAVTGPSLGRVTP